VLIQFFITMLQICKTYSSFGFNITTGTAKHSVPNFCSVFLYHNGTSHVEKRGFGLFNKNHYQVIWTRKFRENSELYMFHYFVFCVATVFQCKFSSECDLVLLLYRRKRYYVSLCVFGSKLEVHAKP